MWVWEWAGVGVGVGVALGDSGWVWKTKSSKRWSGWVKEMKVKRKITKNQKSCVVSGDSVVVTVAVAVWLLAAGGWRCRCDWNGFNPWPGQLTCFSLRSRRRCSNGSPAPIGLGVLSCNSSLASALSASFSSDRTRDMRFSRILLPRGGCCAVAASQGFIAFARGPGGE